MSFRTQELPNTIPVEGFMSRKLNSNNYAISESFQKRCLAQIEKDKRFNTAISLLESLSKTIILESSAFKLFFSLSVIPDAFLGGKK